MLAEGCKVNPFLENKGIEVVESDLGERIFAIDQSEAQDPILYYPLFI